MRESERGQVDRAHKQTSGSPESTQSMSTYHHTTHPLHQEKGSCGAENTTSIRTRLACKEQGHVTIENTPQDRHCGHRITKQLTCCTMAVKGVDHEKGATPRQDAAGPGEREGQVVHAHKRMSGAAGTAATASQHDSRAAR
jgi:hypothetical protein